MALVSENQQFLIEVNIKKILNTPQMLNFLSGKPYKNPEKIPYKLNETVQVLGSQININERENIFRYECQSVLSFNLLTQSVDKFVKGSQRHLQDHRNRTYQNENLQRSIQQAQFQIKLQNQHMGYDWKRPDNVVTPWEKEQFERSQSVSIDSIVEDKERNYLEGRIKYNCIDLFLDYKKSFKIKTSGKLKIGTIKVQSITDCIFTNPSASIAYLPYLLDGSSTIDDTRYYMNYMQICEVIEDDNLTNKVIDDIIQNFVDFIYPFLKNYFDNIDKFNLERADTADIDNGGIMSDIRKFYEHRPQSIMDSLRSLRYKTFGDSDSNPQEDFRQLTSSIEQQNIEKQKNRLKKLESQLMQINQEIDKEQKRSQVNEQKLKQLKEKLEKLKKKKESLLKKAGDGKSGTVVQAAEIVKENKNNLSELRRKSEDRRESRC